MAQPILLKLQQPFELFGFAPVVPNTLPGITRGVAWEPSTSDPNYQLSLDRLSAKTSGRAATGNILLRANTSASSGYFEVLINVFGGSQTVGLTSASAATNDYVGDANGLSYEFNGTVLHAGGTVTGTWATYTSGDVVGVCRKGNFLYFSKNGVWQNSADPSAGTGGIDVSGFASDVLIPATSTSDSTSDITARFTAASMAYPIPTGVTAWDGTTLSSNVTLALTGQSLSIAQGSLLASTALALTGQSLTVSQGSVVPQTSRALSGQSLVVAQGSVAPATSVALTGQPLTIAQGTITAAISLTLSGQALTIAQGSLAPSTTKALTGQALNLAQGSVAPAISITLSGQTLTLAQGNVSVSGNVTVALTGQSLSVAQGSVGPSITATITGQSLSAALGSLTVPAPVTVAIPVFTPPPPQRARTRMHGWRVYQPTPYFAATPPQPLNILPVPIPGVTYIVDANGAYLTDTAGNRIIYG